MKRTPDANIACEWAAGHFAQDADDLLTICMEVAQRVKMTYLGPDDDLVYEIETIITRHTPKVDATCRDADTAYLDSILNELAPTGYYWGYRNDKGQERIGYWKTQ